MVQIHDGQYAVRQVINHDENGNEVLGQVAGRFEIENGKVLRKEGIADDLLRLGDVDGINSYRITISLNNGYLAVVKETYPVENKDEEII